MKRDKSRRHADPIAVPHRSPIAAESVIGAACGRHDLRQFAIAPIRAEAVQRKAAAAPATAARVAAKGGEALSEALRHGLEALAGVAMDDARVFRNSAAPAALGAHAFARGTEIHLAPAQERHLAHEAWHVVQQKQGRVRATGLVAGVPLNDDAALEREADAMGRAATARSARAAPIARSARPGEAAAVQRVSLAGRLMGRSPLVADPTPIQRALSDDLMPEDNLTDQAKQILKGAGDFVWIDGGKYQGKEKSHIHLFTVTAKGMTGQVTIRNVKENGGPKFTGGTFDREGVEADAHAKFYKSEADKDTVEEVTADLETLWETVVEQWEHVFGE